MRKTLIVLMFFFNTLPIPFAFGMKSSECRSIQVIKDFLPTIQLSLDHKKLTTYVPELTYTILKEGVINYALVAPLKPCILVALRNNNTDHTLVAHVHRSNNVNTLLDIADQELHINDTGSIKGSLYTCYMSPQQYSQNYASIIDETHQDVLHKTCKVLAEGLHLDKDALSAILYDGIQDNGFDRSILLDGKANEHGRPQLYSYRSQECLSSFVRNCYVFDTYKQHIGIIRMSNSIPGYSAWTPDTFSFMRVPSNNIASLLNESYSNYPEDPFVQFKEKTRTLKTTAAAIGTGFIIGATITTFLP